MAIFEEGRPREIGIQHIYFNGFSISLSNADLSVVLMINNQPSGAVSMSFTTAKTLAHKLNDVIEKLEKNSGSKIMEIDYLHDVIEKMKKEEDN